MVNGKHSFLFLRHKSKAITQNVARPHHPASSEGVFLSGDVFEPDGGGGCNKAVHPFRP
jgi:hypothetical protein